MYQKLFPEELEMHCFFSLLLFVVLLQLPTVLHAQTIVFWTDNPGLNNNGYHWKARTWKWNVFGEDIDDPIGLAEWRTRDSDWYAYVQTTILGFYDIWVHCSGITQGWVWPSNRPTGIHQPKPLNVSKVGNLYLRVELLNYGGLSLGWGVLTNVWFKISKVSDDGTTYYNAILGIDLYWARTHLIPPDGTFRKNGGNPPVYVYTRDFWGISNVRTVNLYQIIEDAIKAASKMNVHFDINDVLLYQVESLVEAFYFSYNYPVVWAEYTFTSIYYYL
ncbi:MAG: hypothetical protein ACP6IU_11285 [Candidatus Asgardarchaeia archaeon]